MITMPIVMEFIEDASCSVIVNSYPVRGRHGGIKTKDTTFCLDFQKGEQIIARILELTPTHVDVEIIESEKGNLKMGLMLNVPRNTLRPEKKANINWEEE